MMTEAAIIAMPIAANPAAHGAQSTNAPPGICAIKPATVPAARASPSLALGPTQLRKVKGDKGPEAGLDIRSKRNSASRGPAGSV